MERFTLPENMRTARAVPSTFETREDGEDLIIEGYFAVFNSNYEIGEGMVEQVAPGAFTDTISGDIRALINHDTTLVLGRTKAGTLTLREDAHGLWGSVRVNRNDTDAMNLYARVQRGDVDGCSFGFDITREETEFLPDGTVMWRILAVELYEVSCCTFPAYRETNIQARSAQAADLRKRHADARRAEILKKLKGE